MSAPKPICCIKAPPKLLLDDISVRMSTFDSTIYLSGVIIAYANANPTQATTEITKRYHLLVTVLTMLDRFMLSLLRLFDVDEFI